MEYVEADDRTSGSLYGSRGAGGPFGRRGNTRRPSPDRVTEPLDNLPEQYEDIEKEISEHSDEIRRHLVAAAKELDDLDRRLAWLGAKVEVQSGSRTPGA